MSRPLYTWRTSLRPVRGVIRVVSTVEEGRVSRSSFETSAAIPGGRCVLKLEFDYQGQNAIPLEDYSWTCSKLKGNLFRVPVPETAQIARDVDIGVPHLYGYGGIPFEGAAFFEGGSGFAFTPTVDIAAVALEGENTITLDETRYPGILRYGKWIGLGLGCHHIDDVERDGTQVTVTVSPPLHRDFASGELVSLRPSLICQARDIDSFVTMYEPASLIKPGSLTLVEVIDERFL